MHSDGDKNSCPSDPYPPLEKLIEAIDRQVEQVPHPYADETLQSFWGRRDRNYKKQGRQFIRFVLNGTAFALPLQNAMETDYVPGITPLPNVPEWVRGICNLRGDVVSVVELKQILQLEPGGDTTAGKLILIRHQDVKTAVLVDKVVGMISGEDSDEAKDRSQTAKTAASRFVHDVIHLDGESVHLLDVDALMREMKV